ncbi:MAG: hypothetical protein GXP28_05795 [Planctomycetes bacterium]|nr:hypothetical protein [Planctomycetota bacterium]
MKTFFSRLVGGVFLVLLSSAGLRGEVRVVKNFGEEDGFTLYKMTVTAAAEPAPALKHRLCLRPHEYKPGNAATYYLRANAENGLSGAWRNARKEFGEAVDDWYGDSIPLNELPLDMVRKAAGRFDSLVSNFIEPASTRQDCDWGYNLTELRGSEVYAMLLPGAQQSRSIARMLALRSRLAIVEGRFDDAIDHMRMNYRLASNVGQEPILVCGLIGIAIEGVTSHTVIDLISAPDSPNLYWALTELPRPLVDMREAIRLEVSACERVCPILLDAETAEHSPEEWARLIARNIDFLKGLWGSSSGTEEFFEGQNLVGIAVTGLALRTYPAAKQRLLHAGMAVDRVEKMPVGQVLAIDAAREYRRIADEQEKWWYVPFPVARHRMKEAGRRFYDVGLQSGFGATLASLLSPATRAARTAQARHEWQMNALRVIEALRMHAAETGRLPESLDEIQIVPVPENPITTHPYQYHLDGQTAVLELPFSDGMPGVASRYEITLADP